MDISRYFGQYWFLEKNINPSDSGIASGECLLWSQHSINLNFIVDNLRWIRMTVLQRATLAITFAQRPNAAIHTLTNEKYVIRLAEWSENSVTSTIRNNNLAKTILANALFLTVATKKNFNVVSNVV